MVLKFLQRLKPFIHPRQFGIIATTTATVVLGIALYQEKRKKKMPPDSIQAGDKVSVSQTSQFTVIPNKRNSKGKTTLAIQDASGNSTNVKWDYNWDKRDPEALVKPPKTENDREKYDEKVKQKTPSATRHLILVRHGVFVNMDADDQERTLTALGQEQSEMTGQYLNDLDLAYTRMVASTMSRAVETAEIIQKHLPAVKLDRDDLLCEGRPVLPEPVLYSKPDHTYFQDGARIEAAFRKYFHRAGPEQKDDSVEILVCHANVIRYSVCRALQFPPEAWLRIVLPHASVTHIIIRPSGHVYLQGLGSVGHMTPSKVTVSSRGRNLP
ncbi:serine/threonine-protein phosphatase PGAM5, mitochondrial-like [Littorina saxatilis]|uniref:serine/threonine-protein phosphatase PGAM5, mitochondrial-like n=1 Tax=Littorina saxatilis TaxID=31220 RepID=UPI0038B64AEC